MTRMNLSLVSKYKDTTNIVLVASWTPLHTFPYARSAMALIPAANQLVSFACPIGGV